MQGMGMMGTLGSSSAIRQVRPVQSSPSIQSPATQVCTCTLRAMFIIFYCLGWFDLIRMLLFMN